MRKKPKSQTRSKAARRRFKKPRKPPECRHEILRRGHIVNLAAPGITTLFREHMTTTIVVDVKICMTCDAWLSIGTSDESPTAVKVEIRATEMAAESYSDWTSFECHGFVTHPYDVHDRDVVLSADDEPAWWSGWLASEIATHDERNTRDANALPWSVGQLVGHALPVDITPPGCVEIDLIEGGEPEQGVELEIVVGDDPSCPHPEDQVERDRVATECHRCGMVWPTVHTRKRAS